MRPVAFIILSLYCSPFLDAPGAAAAAPAVSGAYHVVLSKRALAAGETVEYNLVPPPPEGVRRVFGLANATGSTFVRDGIYRAPYVIPPGTPPAQVSAGFTLGGTRVTATAEVELLPGSVPGAEDCLGPGQSFSTVTAGIEPDYTYLDELPELIHRVEPEYPRSVFVRGIEDTIPMKALVCRSGRVLDAFALPTFANLGDLQPIERDPKLVEAAIAAVRQYVFKPGLAAGQAYAVWVGVPVAFRH